jgi:hypothetical protein
MCSVGEPGLGEFRGTSATSSGSVAVIALYICRHRSPENGRPRCDDLRMPRRHLTITRKGSGIVSRFHSKRVEHRARVRAECWQPADSRPSGRPFRAEDSTWHTRPHRLARGTVTAAGDLATRVDGLTALALTGHQDDATDAGVPVFGYTRLATGLAPDVSCLRRSRFELVCGSCVGGAFGSASPGGWRCIGYLVGERVSSGGGCSRPAPRVCDG